MDKKETTSKASRGNVPTALRQQTEQKSGLSLQDVRVHPVQSACDMIYEHVDECNHKSKLLIELSPETTYLNVIQNAAEAARGNLAVQHRGVYYATMIPPRTCMFFRFNSFRSTEQPSDCQAPPAIPSS